MYLLGHNNRSLFNDIVNIIYFKIAIVIQLAVIWALSVLLWWNENIFDELVGIFQKSMEIGLLIDHFAH